MTNTEAIRWLESIDRKYIHGGDEWYDEQRHKSIETAIKALEERRQGGWAKTGQSFVNPNKFRNFCCSICLWELDEHIRIEPNFCPNCGADMRGGKE